MRLGAALGLHILPGIWQRAPYRAASPSLQGNQTGELGRLSEGTLKTVTLMPCLRGAHPAEALVRGLLGGSLLAAVSFTPSLLSEQVGA